MNNLKTRIIVAVVLVVAVGGAVWYGLSHKQQSGNAVATPSVSATPITDLTYDAVPSDWTTYSSASLGFKISIPKDWVRGSCGATCVTFADPTNAQVPLVGVNVTPGGKLSDVLTSAKPYIQASGSISFDGIKWTRLVLQEPQTGNIFISHFGVVRNTLYELGLGLIDAPTMKLYGEMVRSFSLIVNK